MRKLMDRKENGIPEADQYKETASEHKYIEDLDRVDQTDAQHWLNVGIDTGESHRAGTFIQKDCSVIHSKSRCTDVEIMSITQAMKTYDWVKNYMWKYISPDKDEYTQKVYSNPHEGYFIRSLPGRKVAEPVQSCLYISEEGLSQNVHNIVIAEENSEMHIITGCATSPHLITGMHVGISEFYVKKEATLHFTMIHHWGESIRVRPRSVIHVEEGGVIVSNYISLGPVGSLQMNPVTYLDGKNAIARFNSILVAGPGSELDVGSKVVLRHSGARAEIISRAITAGGTIIARGEMIGEVEGVKGHLECKGLILKDGVMHAIPELIGLVPGIEMSHEAAVGKIDQREIEYLMARGLDEETAISTIVRGFLNVDIEGLPAGLVAEIDRMVAETQKDVM